jgi:hypothetical protein
MFGGTIEGNGTQILMAECVTITNEMDEEVLQAPTRVAGTDDKIRHVGEMHVSA